MTDEPNQPLQTSSLSGFEGLVGIGDAKDAQARDKTILEKLLQLCDDIKETYLRKRLPQNDDEYGYVYSDCYQDVKEKLNDLVFQEVDINNFVLAKANCDYDEIASIILGIYSGCLVHLLTERNEKEGKRTRIYANGHGNRFDYLFSYARLVDEIIVDNFVGNDICSYIGTNGKVNTAIIRNVNKNYTGSYDVGSNIGENGGEVGSIIYVNVEGEDIGATVGQDKGSVGLIAFINTKGRLMYALGADGTKVGYGLIIDSKDGVIGEEIGENGHVKKLLVYNVNRESALNGCHAEEVHLWKDEIKEDEQAIFQMYGITELVKLLEDLKTAQYPQMLELTDRINKIGQNFLGKSSI